MNPPQKFGLIRSFQHSGVILSAAKDPNPCKSIKKMVTEYKKSRFERSGFC